MTAPSPPPNTTARARCAPAAVRANDWRRIASPAAAAEPVSVVIPYRGGPHTLARALAALERQTHPLDRFEVVVVDDGSPVPVERATETPLDLRIVRHHDRSRGAAWARNVGVRAARHDILVFLDGDVIAEAELVAEHARWHAAIADALTQGFTAYVAASDMDPDAIRNRSGTIRDLLAGRPFDRPFPERHMALTDDLTSGHDDIFRIANTNNLGVRRAFFDAVGGFDESFKRASWEDIEFAYRAYARGALFVPARAARGWHQGRFVPNLDRRKRRHRAGERAIMARLIPHPDFRPASASGVDVPRTVVTVKAAAAAHNTVADTVDALLADRDGDVAIRIAMPPGADAVRLEARFGSRPEVRVAAPATAALDDYPVSPFHVELPAGAAIPRDLLHRLRAGFGDAATGIAVLGSGASVVVRRSWALHRARRTGAPAATFGGVATIHLGRMRLALPVAIRRSHGFRGPVGRLFAEAGRVRRWRDARRFAAWLGIGLLWSMRSRRHLQAEPGGAKPGRAGRDARLLEEAHFHDRSFAGAGTAGTPWAYASAGPVQDRYHALITAYGGPGRHVLELGSGLGSVALRLAAGGARVLGIDISPEAIRKARNRARTDPLTTDVSFELMDAERLSLPDAHFDLVVGHAILHHLDLDAVRAGIARVLKPGGRAVFLEPLGHNVAINLFRRLTPGRRTANEHPLRARDLAALATDFREARFEYAALCTLAALPFRRLAAFGPLLAVLGRIDRLLLTIPVLRHQAWQVIADLAGPVTRDDQRRPDMLSDRTQQGGERRPQARAVRTGR